MVSVSFYIAINITSLMGLPRHTLSEEQSDWWNGQRKKTTEARRQKRRGDRGNGRRGEGKQLAASPHLLILRVSVVGFSGCPVTRFYNFLSMEQSYATNAGRVGAERRIETKQSA